MYQAPLQFSTLNVYRSALSAHHPKIDGYKVGQHPLVKQLMQGAFNVRPPQPRYNDTWDVNVVLEHIVSLGQNENLLLGQLAGKLAVLMGLICVGRSQELSSLDPSTMQDKGSVVVFHVAALTKTRRKGTPPRKLQFVEYPKNETLDVVACLKQYLCVTQSLRTTTQQKSCLFLACVKPHKPVAPCTIARWVKNVMAAAGIDVGKYKPHSVRGASTSKADKFGLSTAQILERANWSQATTFHKYYHREITDEFQDKVLSLE